MIEPPDSAEQTKAAPNSGQSRGASDLPPTSPWRTNSSGRTSSTPTPPDAQQIGGGSLETASDPDSLERQISQLKREIIDLQSRRDRLIQDQTSDVQAAVTRLINEGLADLEQRRKTLQMSVDQLERRQERIRAEMRKSFAGASQDLAVRVQGFKDYLVGSLQDLAATAEQLELGSSEPPASAPSPTSPSIPSSTAGRSPEATPMPLVQRRQRPASGERPDRRGRSAPPPAASSRSTPSRSLNLSPPQASDSATNPLATDQPTNSESDHIRQLLQQYRTIPNYYGPPWRLRRTFEPVHADRASKWFFELGRRGAIKTMGSRLQNVLVASAIISALREVHGDRIRALILGDSPERLGEWRRGLQDCLGISRMDFGAQKGVVLFEASEAVSQRADRLVEQGQLPLILIDEGEDKVSLSLLQFPLWLAFAPDPADTLPIY
ncbi:MAG: DUF3086 domain-containing protein [Elainellaceae cyanobacterium]